MPSLLNISTGIWFRILLMQSLVVLGIGFYEKSFAGLPFALLECLILFFTSLHMVLMIYLAIHLSIKIPYSNPVKMGVLVVMLISFYILNVFLWLVIFNRSWSQGTDRFFQLFLQREWIPFVLLVIVVLAAGWSRPTIEAHAQTNETN